MSGDFERRMQNPSPMEGAMRGLGLKGTLPDLIAPDVRLTIQALDLTAEENTWLRRESRFAVGGTQAAGGAGTFTGIFLQVVNPDMVVIVDEVLVLLGAAGFVVVGIGFNPGFVIPITAYTPAIRDARQTSFISSLSILGDANAGLVIPNGVEIRFPAAGQTQRLAGPWVLTNRFDAGLPIGLAIVTRTANADLTFGVNYRERRLQPNER